MRTRRLRVFWLPLLFVCGCVLGKSPARYQGEIPGQPVSYPVTVVRDAQGVPHIYAREAGDLFFALGYTMAQDRLFQMDLFRHTARGRLCEWFGNVPLGDGMRLVQMDMLLKCFQLGERAEGALPAMPPDSRRLLERFTEGINQFVRESRDRRPTEYRLLCAAPEPWTAADVMSIPELFGLGLSLIGLGTEVLHEAMEHAAGPRLTLDFFRRYTGLPLPDPAGEAPAGAAGAGRRFGNLLRAGSVLRAGVPQGSNNWAVSGSRSRSGKPLLGNDPHVPLGLAPSFWYHAHLQGGGFSVEGLLYAGYPAFGAAWNGDVAWGVTNIMADQTDLFRERLDPADPDRYETADGWRRFDAWPVACKVRLGRDRTFVLKRGVHGFLVPREALENRFSRRNPWMLEPVCLRYVDTDPGAYFHGQRLLMQARDSAQVKDALRQIGRGPTAYNYVWACRDGDIGYHAAGLIPVRGAGPGFAVKDGWAPGAGWKGVVPFNDLPARENPPDGILATANEKIAPPDYPWYISAEYAEPYRADRIRQLLANRALCSAEGFQRIQADVHNLAAAPYLRVLEEVYAAAGARDALSEPERSALDTLLSWDRQTAAGSAGAALFEVFLQELLEDTFADELGKELAGPALKTNFMAAKVMKSLLEDPDNPWFDRRGTGGVEGRDRIFQDAFREAVRACRKQMGSRQEAWAWGRIHTVKVGHPFGLLPLSSRSLRIGTFAYPGDNDTVNGGYFVFDDGRYPVVAGAASRFVADLARPSGAWFNCSTGMAGEPSSPYFENLTAGWVHGQYFWTPLAPDPEGIPAGSRLVLEP